MKTSELTGAALDWAVCEATGLLAAYTQFRTGKNFLKVWGVAKNAHLHPSTDWAQGGPIIERIKGFLFKHWLEMKRESHQCQAEIHNYDGDWIAFGPTPLIAALRCFVASRLGDNVAIPADLLI